MKKDVLIAIEGLQFLDDPSGEKIEVIAPGLYYRKKNHHYVFYDEVMEDSSEVTKNVLKFDDDVVSISKKGFTNVDMVFEKNKRNMTDYNTPYGTLLVGIDSKNVSVTVEEDVIGIEIDYVLDVNYQHLADCKIKMKIMSKSAETTSILGIN